jgi:hypothetical protein
MVTNPLNCVTASFLPICSLVNLPAGTGAADLLSASGKKSMLKEGAAWKTGPVRTCDAKHMDEARLKLQIQVGAG